jgi:hypothetical protein
MRHPLRPSCLLVGALTAALVGSSSIGAVTGAADPDGGVAPSMDQMHEQMLPANAPGTNRMHEQMMSGEDAGHCG